MIRTAGARVGGLLAAALLLCGCGELGPSAAKVSWAPKPEGPPPGELPIPDQGNGPDGPGAPGPIPGVPAPGTPGDLTVVATGLTLPWGLLVLPDGSALVGERRSGRILRIRPRPGKAEPLMRVPGLDATGDGGLLDLALSPTYDKDKLLFAYITTPTDNRVVRFALKQRPTPVLTGIPKGRTGNGGRLVFDSAGRLYIGTGDAGHPELARDRKSLAGKVLRVTSFGKPTPGNPNASSPVFSRGHRDVTGLCLGSRDQVFAVEPGTAGDEINRITADGEYGWPRPAASSIEPVRTLSRAVSGTGGCAVLARGMFIAGLTSQQLLALPLDNAGTPRESQSLLVNDYGRLRTVVAGSDGALWLTTSNRDGVGMPMKLDDRVIRILPPDSATNSPA